MNKMKKIGVLTLLGMILGGCSCSKVNEDTYESAASVFSSTDGIAFSRIETIQTANEDIKTRKKVDAKYVFDSNKNVISMQYERTTSKLSEASNTNIGSDVVTKYYYNGERKTLYTYSDSVNKYKQKDVNYNDVFNINISEGDELLMIVGSFAPIFKLNEVEGFTIEKEDDKAVVNFHAVCPSYENCTSGSEVIEYEYVIGSDGNIESLSYVITNGSTTNTINYVFHAYGSNNVNIEFPSDLESYIEKK